MWHYDIVTLKTNMWRMGGLRPIIGVDVGWLVGWGKQEQQLENGSLGKPSFKKNFRFMKNFHKMVPPPPPSCICEILIQIFNRKFRDKIKMRQNSVNNHQSHPKFRCSTRLMLWTSYLSVSYTSKHPILAQNMPFWAFKFLNKSMKTSSPPPPPVCEFFS